MTAEPRPALSSGEAAYRRLRDDIVFGRLEPGRKLRLEGLRAPYGASVATLREVLPQLAAEGLILFEAQKGFEVAPVSARDLAEIAELRLLLEGRALALAFERGDLEWEAGVVAAHHKLAHMESRMLAGDRSAAEAWKRYDRGFHRALLSDCGSLELLAAWDRIFDRFLRYQMLLVVFRGRIAVEEHAGLRDCAIARDVPRAQALLRHHIDACVDYTVEHNLLDGARAP